MTSEILRVATQSPWSGGKPLDLTHETKMGQWVRKDEEKSKRKADVAVSLVGSMGTTPSSLTKNYIKNNNSFPTIFFPNFTLACSDRNQHRSLQMIMRHYTYMHIFISTSFLHQIQLPMNTCGLRLSCKCICIQCVSPEIYLLLMIARLED